MALLHTRPASIFVMAGLVVMACGGRTVPLGSGSDGGTSSGATVGASSDSVGESSGSSTSSGGTGGDPTCERPTEPAVAIWSVDPPQPLASAQCDVLEIELVGSDPPTVRYSMSCEGENGPTSVTLSMQSSGLTDALDLYDIPVLLTYVVDMPWWENRWFTLKSVPGDPSELLAAGIAADQLLPQGDTSESFFQVLRVEEQQAPCGPQMGECSLTQDMGLHVSTDDHSADVFAGGSAFVGQNGGFVVSLAAAHKTLPPIQCSDLPGGWWSALFTYVDG